MTNNCRKVEFSMGWVRGLFDFVSFRFFILFWGHKRRDLFATYKHTIYLLYYIGSHLREEEEVHDVLR